MKKFIFVISLFTISNAASAQNRMNAVSLDRASFNDEFVPEGFTRSEFVAKLRELEKFKKRIKEIDSAEGRQALLESKRQRGEITEVELTELISLNERMPSLRNEKTQLLSSERSYTQNYLTRYSYAADPWMEAVMPNGDIVRCHLSHNKLIYADSNTQAQQSGVWPTAHLSRSAGPYVSFYLAQGFSFGVDYYETFSGGSVSVTGQHSMPKAFQLPNSAQQICPIPAGSMVYMRAKHLRE